LVRRVALALVFIAMLATACSAGSPTSAPVAAAAPSPSATLSLPGTSWTVVGIRYEPIKGDPAPTIAFGTDGTVSGTTGCDSYTATYKVDGEFITIGPLTMTKVACDATVTDQAATFANALPKIATWKVLSNGNFQTSGPQDTQASYIIEAKPSSAD
jgi:heat shock protein HslJ